MLEHIFSVYHLIVPSHLFEVIVRQEQQVEFKAITRMLAKAVQEPNKTTNTNALVSGDKKMFRDKTADVS